MKITIFFLSLLFGAALYGQSGFSGYYERNDISMTGGQAMRYGAYGFDNPAMLAMLDGSELYIFNTSAKDRKDYYRWGVFSASPGFGFYMTDNKSGSVKVTDFRISTGMGDKRAAVGFSYGWSNGDAGAYGRYSFAELGILYRPLKYLTLGGVYHQSVDGDQKEAMISAAVRPLGNEKVSLFADWLAIRDRSGIREFENEWSAGITAEVVPGLRLTGRYFERKQFTAGIEIGLGNFGLSGQTHYNDDSKYEFSTYGIRLGSRDRNLTDLFTGNDKVLAMNLTGGIKYQRYRWLDNSNTLIEMLESVKNAAADEKINAVFLNLSSFNAPPAFIWELRAELLKLKAAGKKIYVYIDQASMFTYHLASVGDYIMIDSQGLIQMTGVAMSRNFYKGLLEKIGIGFDEWRFFKYKSAYENFSNEKMTEGDREQRQALVDNMYDVIRDDIIKSREMSSAQFDSLINYQAIFTPGMAVSLGLADTVVRYDKIREIIAGKDGYIPSFISFRDVNDNAESKDRYWGEKPVIAVIYALGACAMDDGISARTLINYVKRAGADKNVKAIVLRVDSPGGSPLASDYIAEAMKDIKGKKPLIVTQGTVAASGGYWLSMYADTIIASPVTVTGSIGVIGGWAYNKGLKETLGVSIDGVKKGNSADIGTGLVMPLLGLTLPDRNLTPEERKVIEKMILSSYDDFVERVAAGRKMTTDEVRKIAQGRVWNGYDGKKIGLVDVIGGLKDAINIAAERAGLTEYQVLEYPEMPLLDFSAFLPIPGLSAIRKSSEVTELLLRLEHNGKPLHMLPLDSGLENFFYRTNGD